MPRQPGTTGAGAGNTTQETGLLACSTQRLMDCGLQRLYHAAVWLSGKPLGQHHCQALTPGIQSLLHLLFQVLVVLHLDLHHLRLSLDYHHLQLYQDL